ncbi:hypothetical protein [Lysinibacillus piscis]|uniref:hypothetical protein n=1 Tax=Lysinibacillus piscis TaxID=2518931 RepID=UPI0022325AD1|nr:hypothetical protein [Lysinibacillus sp. KH24]
MRGIERVPQVYIEQANKQYWRYLIPEYFPSYKPADIDLMDQDEILEHLAAIHERMKREQEQRQYTEKYLAALLGRKV